MQMWLLLLLYLQVPVADENDNKEDDSIESYDKDDQGDNDGKTLWDEHEDKQEDGEGKLIFWTLKYWHHCQEKFLPNNVWAAYTIRLIPTIIEHAKSQENYDPVNQESY